MAYSMGNILRVIDECINLEFNHKRIDLLNNMKIQLEDLENCVHKVEMQAVYDEKVYAWASDVQSLCEEVEAVIVAYHLQALKMYQISASTACKHLQYFFSKFADTTSKVILNVLPNKPMSSEEVNPLLLRKNRWLGLSYFEEKFLPVALPRLGSRIGRLCRCLIDEARGYNLVSAITSKQTFRLFPSSAEELVKATRMVGREDEVGAIENYLMEQKQKMAVVSLIGRSGIGKTTVATAVYKRVKQYFDCHAWVSVSQKSRAKVLQEILISFLDSLSTMAPRNLEALPIVELKEKIRSLLKGKKCLLFLDDLQKNSDDWECIQNAFPVECKANILITTRYSGTVPISEGFQQNLGPLTPNQSLQLLRKHAFLEHPDSKFWNSVQSLARDIVELCEGNPLAISMIGGMLSAKREISDWKTVNERLTVMTFIPCCYADLHPVLKSCFHYCSLLPPQYEISCKRLTRLWIAEGFLEKKFGGRTIEDTASYQLYELIKRGMIQIGKVGSDGEIKTCQVLRKMQDFALQQSSIDRFPDLLELEGSSFTKSGYHLSLHDTDDTSISNNSVKFRNLNLNKLYSFLGFTGRKDHVQIVTTNCTFKLLLVLELQHHPLENLPKAVEDLVLLTYLGLRATKLKTLPTSLKKLVRLQTLDIRGTSIRIMPTELDNLKRLRHLLLASSFDDKTIDLSGAEVECFQCLQTLAGVKTTQGIATGLRHVTQLKKLSVGMIRTEFSIPLLESIKHLQFLRSLTIRCAPGEKIELRSQFLPIYLEKLRVGGQVKNLPHTINRLKFLRFLYMWDCLMTEDPLPLLHPLKNLVVLSLCNAYVGEKIRFAESYPQLKKLSILRFKYLKKFGKIMTGSMQKLEMLTIGYCPRLKAPPRGLENLTSIQEMQLASLPADFVQEVQEFHSKQKHLRFSLMVRDMTEHEPPSSTVSHTTISFPPTLPPYDFSRAQSTTGDAE